MDWSKVDLKEYSSGIAMDCPVCGEWMEEGDDCPSEHFAEYFSSTLWAQLG